MRVLILLACAALLSLPTGAAFFEPGPVAPDSLPADKLYPQGQQFPMGGFSGIPERDKAAGFNCYGPVYGQQAVFLTRARENGLFAIYTVAIEMNFLEKHDKPKKVLTSEEIREEIARQVSAVAEDETIAWWYLRPEELRYWKEDEIEYLRAATEAIRENDPLQRPIWMYEPNHRNTAALMETNQYLDIIGKGTYTNYAGQKYNRVWCRWSLEQEIEAAKRLGGGQISILVPEMWQEPEPEERTRIEAWVRHDCYAGLVADAKGIFVFSNFARANFPSFYDYYAAYSQIAQEMTGSPQLGQVFLFGERRYDVTLTVTNDAPMVSPKIGVGGMKEEVSYSPVSMANIAYGEDRYLFLVNSGEVSAEVQVEGIPEEALLADAFSGTSLDLSTRPVVRTLAPLEILGWKISPKPQVALESAANEY